ncbi:MAG TPA: hypothetical protein VMZ27_07870 [Candidatus Saccharimonadales bacterium]|nr:hypothetical protein [Candidatus Saccharimonadales bacterium]
MQPVWDLSKAAGENTPSRARICINGLWRWQPAQTSDSQAPSNHWGFFKVPGCWPGITDYMQKDFQTVWAHPAWKNEKLGNLTAAWYERTINIPKNWDGRRIALSIDYLNSFAVVYLDGTRCGELRFPGGEFDLSKNLRPGSTQVLSLLVIAMPLKGVMLSYADSNSAREVKGKVERRGLCGDVYLVSTPQGPRMSDTRVETSVRRGKIQIGATLEGLKAGASYSLQAQIRQGPTVIKEFNSKLFADNGPFTFAQEWKPEKFWDTHTPTNQYELTLSLMEGGARVLDTGFPVSFGFREFWIDGRDFYLNGSRIYLCAVPLDNAQVGAALTTYAGARESLQRLKSIGINFVYTHNYGCEPGSHLGFEEILRAADDVGMLVSMTQPHFSHYDWKSPDAEKTNGYLRHAEFYARVVQNHPSVVAYAMSHNATGYEEDMNPDLIDGIHDPRDQWSSRNAKLALRAEALVKQLDSTRVIYHHASGNLGSMHAINFYPNFVPVQELSDWFEHWATTGVKPVFTCEFGAPFTWDWTMYRGWYKGQREFGSAQVPWEYCLAEWNSQSIGDSAFKISKAEAANLRWEAKQFRSGKGWHRWDYPNAVGSPVFDEQYPVFAMYLNDNWRSFRTWGVSAISPWEYGVFWKLRPGVERARKDLKVDWEKLQRPGFSPDYIDQQYERMDLAHGLADWVPTAAATALLRNNGPLLAWIAGKAQHFTSKDHLFTPGETIEKQIVIINNSRETVSGKVSWTFSPLGSERNQEFTLQTGNQQRVPLIIPLPDTLAPGPYEIRAEIRFSTGEVQRDNLSVQVLPRTRNAPAAGRIGLFDPKGQTATHLKRLGARFELIDPTSELASFDTVIIGKEALTVEGKAPDLGRVRKGLKVIVFEQTAEVLEKRLGFRVAEYGLRNLFPRVPEHPLLAGIGREAWRDWRGAATLIPPKLDYSLHPRYGPTVNWCSIPVTRLWRCGNWGNVASVLIEKPARGNFLPILDGGYSLQYSPLLEYREGKGLILFSQLDLTGRTENEPAADALTRNLLSYVAGWKPGPVREAFYAGYPEGRKHLEAAGFAIGKYQGGKLSQKDVLIVGPNGISSIVESKGEIDAWRKSGGKVVALGLSQDEMDRLVSPRIQFQKAEHIATWFEPLKFGSLLDGIGPADLHNRDPRGYLLVDSGARPLGDGLLAETGDESIALCQFLPWEFAQDKQANLKRTFRRASFSLTRLLANVGVESASPILDRLTNPMTSFDLEKRWRRGLYLDQPEEWDDPYRFFRW